MAPRYDDEREYAEWEEDPEGPQEADLAAEDEDETPTVPCPSCGGDIPDFADRCPYCGDWVVPSAGRAARPGRWVTAIAVLLVAALVLWFAR